MLPLIDSDVKLPASFGSGLRRPVVQEAFYMCDQNTCCGLLAVRCLAPFQLHLIVSESYEWSFGLV